MSFAEEDPVCQVFIPIREVDVETCLLSLGPNLACFLFATLLVVVITAVHS